MCKLLGSLLTGTSLLTTLTACDIEVLPLPAGVAYVDDDGCFDCDDDCWDCGDPVYIWGPWFGADVVYYEEPYYEDVYVEDYGYDVGFDVGYDGYYDGGYYYDEGAYADDEGVSHDEEGYYADEYAAEGA